MRGGADVFLSVVVAAFNAERFIGEAVDSVLRQTHSDFELIVVNDGSTDRTLEILRDYESRDPRIAVYSQENMGASSARNQGIESAKSCWVALMDADDIAEPYWLETQLAFVWDQPSLAVSSCLLTYIDDTGRVIGKGVSELISDEGVNRVRERGDIIIISNSGPLIRREIFEQLGGFRPNVWPGEDVDLYNRIADAGFRVLVQPKHLVRYRIHPGSATGLAGRRDLIVERWIRQCSVNRRRGVPEPKWEDYVRLRRQLPILQRANECRKDYARILYNQATFAYSSGERLLSCVLIASSTILRPSHAPRQVWRKFLHPLFRSNSAAERQGLDV